MLADHAVACAQRATPCVLGWGATVRRHKMAAHWQAACSAWFVTCFVCHEAVERRPFAAHLQRHIVAADTAARELPRTATWTVYCRSCLGAIPLAGCHDHAPCV